jgi:hypothetical protein
MISGLLKARLILIDQIQDLLLVRVPPDLFMSCYKPNREPAPVRYLNIQLAVFKKEIF